MGVVNVTIAHVNCTVSRWCEGDEEIENCRAFMMGMRSIIYDSGIHTESKSVSSSIYVRFSRVQ